MKPTALDHILALRYDYGGMLDDARTELAVLREYVEAGTNFFDNPDHTEGDIARWDRALDAYRELKAGQK